MLMKRELDTSYSILAIHVHTLTSLNFGKLSNCFVRLYQKINAKFKVIFLHLKV